MRRARQEPSPRRLLRCARARVARAPRERRPRRVQSGGARGPVLRRDRRPGSARARAGGRGHAAAHPERLGGHAQRANPEHRRVRRGPRARCARVADDDGLGRRAQSRGPTRPRHHDRQPLGDPRRDGLTHAAAHTRVFAALRAAYLGAQSTLHARAQQHLLSAPLRRAGDCHRHGREVLLSARLRAALESRVRRTRLHSIPVCTPAARRPGGGARASAAGERARSGSAALRHQGLRTGGARAALVSDGGHVGRDGPPGVAGHAAQRRAPE